MTVEATQHGSLLAVSSLVLYCQDFVGPRFQELCEAVFSFTNHSKALIRMEVIRIIPRLAHRSPKVFGRHYLEQALLFLMDCASAPTGQRPGVPYNPLRSRPWVNSLWRSSMKKREKSLAGRIRRH
jgi:hypothetical protein